MRLDVKFVIVVVVRGRVVIVVVVKGEVIVVVITKKGNFLKKCQALARLST